MEDFIATNKLKVLNLPSDLMTYSGLIGESNIDITLAGDTLAGVDIGWSVSNKVATSDHNLILIAVGSRRAGRVAASAPWEAAFDLKRADWNGLRESIRFSLTAETLENLNLRDVNSKEFGEFNSETL